jgi:hypothetical protein
MKEIVLMDEYQIACPIIEKDGHSHTPMVCSFALCAQGQWRRDSLRLGGGLVHWSTLSAGPSPSAHKVPCTRNPNTNRANSSKII